jgi:hypothetical protein
MQHTDTAQAIRLATQAVVSIMIVGATIAMMLLEIAIPDSWWVFATSAVAFTFNMPNINRVTPVLSK